LAEVGDCRGSPAADFVGAAGASRTGIGRALSAVLAGCGGPRCAPPPGAGGCGIPNLRPHPPINELTSCNQP
jgi:hypothetical protein